MGYRRDEPYYADGRNNDHKSLVDTYTPDTNPSTTNDFATWLYKGYDGQWSEEDQARFERLYSVPGIRQYFDYLLDVESRKRIFDLYGIDWSDVRDPRNVKGANSASRLHGYTLNFVSDNIKRLYH